MATPLPREARTRNRSGAEHCRFCDDTSYVVVAVRYALKHGNGEERVGPFEEVGPCPFCELGFAEEFPDLSKRKEQSRPTEPPWGDAGFWQGRPTTEIRPLYEGPRRFLSHEENARRMRLLAAKVGAVAKPVDEAPADHPAAEELCEAA